MSQIHLPQSVLYFPSIEFQDEGWLRSALCIWDRVDRIVPAGYTPRDSDDVRHLHDLGLVQSIQLSRNDTDEAASDFLEFVKSNPCQPSALVEDEERFSFLHKGKVGERLHDFFDSIRNPLHSDEDWYGIPQSLCHGYMMRLAEAVARRRGISKVTDNKDAFSVAPFFDSGGHVSEFGFSPEDAHAHAVLGLTTIVPREASSIPITSLIEFRQRTDQGRRALAIEVARCAADIAAIADSTAATQRLADACEEFRKSRQRITEQSAYNGRDLGNSVICVGLPVLFGAILAGSNPFNPAVIGGGLAVTLVASMGQAYANKRHAPVAPARSYLLELEKHVESVFHPRYRNRGNDFWAVMEEFVND